MKLYTFCAADQQDQRIGALMADGTTILALQDAYAEKRGTVFSGFSDMLAFLDKFSENAEKAAILLSEAEAGDHVYADCRYLLSEVTVLAPVPRPRTIRDCSLYEDHMINCGKSALIFKGAKPEEIEPEACKPGKSWYTMPIYYKGNPWSVVGTGTDIEFPEGEGFRDYELELGFFVGKKGKNIKPEEALDHVAAFTVFNDFSARLLQLAEMIPPNYLSPAKGKDFDTGNVMGPCLVTKDEFDYTDAKMTVKVNGELRGGGNSGEIYYPLEQVIAHISRDETIYPGDFIGFGTVPTGTGLEFLRPLETGDVVELEIEGIGKLINRVVK